MPSPAPLLVVIPSMQLLQIHHPLQLDQLCISISISISTTAVLLTQRIQMVVAVIGVCSFLFSLLCQAHGIIGTYAQSQISGGDMQTHSAWFLHLHPQALLSDRPPPSYRAVSPFNDRSAMEEVITKMMHESETYVHAVRIIGWRAGLTCVAEVNEWSQDAEMMNGEWKLQQSIPIHRPDTLFMLNMTRTGVNTEPNSHRWRTDGSDEAQRRYALSTHTHDSQPSRRGPWLLQLHCHDHRQRHKQRVWLSMGSEHDGVENTDHLAGTVAIHSRLRPSIHIEPRHGIIIQQVSVRPFLGRQNILVAILLLLNPIVSERYCIEVNECAAD